MIVAWFRRRHGAEVELSTVVVCNAFAFALGIGWIVGLIVALRKPKSQQVVIMPPPGYPFGGEYPVPPRPVSPVPPPDADVRKDA